ncbi:hypothetical protein [Levilactobacillus enshiensis]|uniref:hypothetical protein n=1 Tax=Levilactobacillus enshiensis TaxID=2590213 RepID=UPI00117A4D19|nr:hypothetical protein [Levilactobacillus enshiensis]
MKQWGKRYTTELGAQANEKAHQIMPWLLLGVLVASIILMAAKQTTIGFGLIGLDFFFLADYWTVSLAHRRLFFVWSFLLGTLAAAIVSAVGLFVLGVIFHQ